jgi:hypothetical protein
MARQLEGPLRRTVLLQGLHTLTLIPDDDTGRIIGGEMRGEARSCLLKRCLEQVAVDLEADRELLLLALEAVRMIHDGEARERALDLLRGSPMPGREVDSIKVNLADLNKAEPEALLLSVDAALAERDGFIRAFKLKRLLPQLARNAAARDLLMTASLDLSPYWMDRIQLCVANACLSPRLPTYELWHTLVLESRLDRLLLLNVTDELAGCAVQLTGRADVADGIARAVEDVCRWWP